MTKQITIKDDEEIVEVEVKKTGEVEIAAEDEKFSATRTLSSGTEYVSHYFHDEIYEGPCKVILIRKKKGVDVVNENGDLIK
jgi:hypothetical protein